MKEEDSEDERKALSFSYMYSSLYRQLVSIEHDAAERVSE